MPIYYFDDDVELGIDKVPNNKKVLIKDDGTGSLREVLKISNTGLTSYSTIADFLADASLYIDTSNTGSTSGSGIERGGLAWEAAIDYKAGDVISAGKGTNSGSLLYTCIANHTSSNSFAADAANWSDLISDPGTF